MTSNELRKAYLEYFADLDHTVVSSASLLPKDDPTLLFISAGMVQFKPYWSGLVDPPYRRAVSSQKCLRLSDIDEVGKTHLSFFEMLGNFSFGDYFKREAIEWGWRFLVDILKIDKERLSASVHKDDEEAFKIWQDIGLTPIRLGDKDNFWGPAGNTGACGPCSEIFYDLGTELGCGKDSCGPGCDCGRFPEVWNLVFPQFDQQVDGTRKRLKNRGIDTGMGMERLTMVVNKQKSFFSTDLFKPIIDRLSQIIEVDYQENELAFNIIADHIRALVFAIGDGIIPSNESRGYVLRRLLRRALLYGQKLGYHQPFLYQLAKTVIDLMGDTYPEIVEKHNLISLILEGEEKRFLKTISAGLNVFDSLAKKKMSGEDAFLLYDSYGFPIELTKELARQKGVDIDIDAFYKAMEQRRHQSRQASEFTTIDLKLLKEGQTRFVGYDQAETESDVIGYALNDSEIFIAIDPTPFYPESGGQIGDHGIITGDDFEIKVLESFYYQGMIIERGEIKGNFKPTKVRATIDQKRRDEIMRAHTATHLLHKSLKQVIGDWIRQEGSLVEPGRFRFDFLQFNPLSDEELIAVEDMVYRMVLDDLPVEKFYTDYNSAVKMGAVALFGEKYGEKVRVVKIGDFSIELCGGLHLNRTGEIGAFKITSESSVAAGIRRIEALVGLQCFQYLRQNEKFIKQLKGELGENIINRTRQMNQDLKRLTGEVKSLKQRLASRQVSGQDLAHEQIGTFSFYYIESDLGVEGMRLIADKLRKKGNCGGLIYQNTGETVAFVSQDQIDKINAVTMMNIVKDTMGGGGGGRRDLAQGGGSDIKRINHAIEALRHYFKEKIAH